MFNFGKLNTMYELLEIIQEAAGFITEAIECME